MTSGNLRKAALLLMSLDSSTAAELLRAAKPEVVTQLATEVAYLEAAGQAKAAPALAAKEFAALLGRRRRKEKAGGNFLRDVLETAMGKQESQQLIRQVQDMVVSRDPFLPLRSSSARELGHILAGESPQVVALVMAELPPKVSTDLLPLLDEKVRVEAVCQMTGGEEVAPETRLRVASVIRARLEAMRKPSATGEVVAAEPTEDRRLAKLRRVAVLLRSLKSEHRDVLLDGIGQGDVAVKELVQQFMVIWEDLPVVPDRALQESLRRVDSKKLALSLVGADPVVAQKVRSNISERANAMLDEETSLLSSPKKEDVEHARQEILNALREKNAKGELAFEA